MPKLDRFEISERRIHLFDISKISKPPFDRASLVVHVHECAFKVLCLGLSSRKFKRQNARSGVGNTEGS